MRRSIVVLFLVLSLSLFAQEYVPLSLDEAKAYVARAGIDAVAADIVKLDFIEHAIPSVTFPGAIYALSGRDLVVAYPGQEPAVLVEVKPYLSYSIRLTPTVIPKFVPSTPWWKKALPVVTASLGAAMVPALFSLTGHPNYDTSVFVASLVVGIGIGAGTILVTGPP